MIKNQIKKLSRIMRRMVRGENLLLVPQEKDKWDRQYERGTWQERDKRDDAKLRMEMLAGVISAHTKEKSIRILDVGCGTGAIIPYLQKLPINFSYVGIDISEKAIAEAKEKYPAYTFVCQDIEKELFSTEDKFDVAILSEVLYYAHPRIVLRSIRDILEKDGVLVISMYETWRNRLLWFFTRSMLFNTAHIRLRVGKLVWIVKKVRYKEKAMHTLLFSLASAQNMSYATHSLLF